MYAIIETGGKQYRATPGDVLFLESLAGDAGQTVTFDKVLLVGGAKDSPALVGTPYVPQAKLLAEIVEQGRGDKILTIKYKRRKGYRRVIGHRQAVTRVLVTKLEDGRGQSLQFDSALRSEVLRKANIAFSQREEKRAAAAKPAKKEAAPKTAAAPKAAAASKAPKKKTATKKA